MLNPLASTVIASVDWIKTLDITAPYGEATYAPDTPTSGNVIVTITTNESVKTPDGRDGTDGGTVFTKEYTINRSGSVEIEDIVGNTGSVDIEVNWIDKEVPHGEASYIPKTLTNGDVMVTITADEPIRIPADRSGEDGGTEFTKVYTGNRNENVEIEDMVGNRGSVYTEVSRIDKTPPKGQVTVVMSGRNAIVTLTTDEPIRMPVPVDFKYSSGRSGVDGGTQFVVIFYSNYAGKFYIEDLAGNEAVVAAKISQIKDDSPIVMLSGDASVEIYVGQSYIEW